MVSKEEQVISTTKKVGCLKSLITEILIRKVQIVVDWS